MGTHVKLDGQGRLFKNPFLEALTKSSPLESTLSSLLIAAACIWMGKGMGAGFTFWNITLNFLAGFAFWTLSEYLLHRYIFHLTEKDFKGADRFAYIIHGIHHEYPNDAQRTLMPFIPKLVFSAFFFGIFLLILGKKGAFFASGFTMGYYFYSIMHYAIHRIKAPAWLKPLWEHHHRHHHLNEDKAFGVSFTLWDRVFGTMPEKVKNKSKTAEV